MSFYLCTSSVPKKMAPLKNMQCCRWWNENEWRIFSERSKYTSIKMWQMIGCCVMTVRAGAGGEVKTWFFPRALTTVVVTACSSSSNFTPRPPNWSSVKFSHSSSTPNYCCRFDRESSIYGFDGVIISLFLFPRHLNVNSVAAAAAAAALLQMIPSRRTHERKSMERHLGWK